MENNAVKIVIETEVNAPIEKVWKCWTTPADIMAWNQASDDWHTTSAEVDLREGGKFSSHMAAKDGSFGFDFGGTYTKVVPNECLEYKLEDDRRVSILFEDLGGSVKIVETFEAESENPAEMQQQGWQMILNSFKRHTENA